MIEIVKHYRDDAVLRNRFNQLAEVIFGLNFESWYRNGFWGDNYDPYSVLMDRHIIANVEFYPKFGFTKGAEYVYTRPVAQAGENHMQKIPIDSEASWNKLRKAMETSSFRTECHMVDNPGLIFFYVSQFMQDCVYHDDQLGAWVIAELENEQVLIHNVFAKQEITLDDVIASFGDHVSQVTLGFTPANTNGYCCKGLKEDDCTFFVKGNAFNTFAAEKMRIPSLAHA